MPAETPQTPLVIIDPPPGYPPEWVGDAVLKDGGTIRIRPIAPQDGVALRAFVRNLSAESSYFRFFRVKHDLEPEEVRAFTELDYLDSMAFVAVHEGRLIGVGRYTKVDAVDGLAEVAFAVADDQQGRGIGTVLLNRLTAYARNHGIDKFRAFLLAGNYAMMRVFRDSGFHLARDLDEGVYTVDFPTEESDATREVGERNERTATRASLMPLFYPTSIAVIGASRDPLSIGGRLFANLISGGFTGPVFPVNPKSPVVRSVKGYPTVVDIPDPVDLAFIVVPAALVIDSVRQCAEKGVKAIVVITAGFSETGEQGKALEEELLSVVRDTGMRMVGPNCMGIVNTDPTVAMDGQFGPLTPPPGNVAMSSQSGALGLAILDHAKALNIGISMFVSVGNKSDVSGNDLLLFWEEHAGTDVILLYLESFGNPRRFARLARRIGKTKPIVAVKSGRTAAGARAASSHTGSLASLDVAVDALFRQAGVIRVETLEELFDVTALLSNQPVPSGRRVGLVTNAGGPAILAVDALESRGFQVPELSADTQSELRGFLPADASVRNPVDMIAAAGPDEYRKALDILLRSDELDSVVAMYVPASPVGMEATARVIREAGEAHHGAKTFLTVFMRSLGAPPELSSGESKIPAFPFPERAAMALEAAAHYGEWRRRPEGAIPGFDDLDPDGARDVVGTALTRLGEDGGWLEPADVDRLLAAYGIRVPRSQVVADGAEAVRVAADLGSPVVLKVLSPSALHKSDVGGVALDVVGDDEVTAAFDRVWGAVPDPQGVLVQEFVSGGHEVLIGMVEDPNFGPLIVFGLGGVFVELIGDVAFRIHPLTDLDAAEMVGEVKSARLLEGYRGAEPGDVAAVRETLLRVSAMIGGLPEIAEMDLNPVKVGPPGAGVTVVDARVRVRRVPETWLPSRDDLVSSV
jgi:acetate---CoA ligase (ADP-forming)